MHVPFAQEKRKLLFRKIRIDLCERNAVKCQVPGGIPGIFPFVGHRNDVGVIKSRPFVIAATFSALGWWRPCGIAFEPGVYVEVVELLRPQEAGECLSLYVPSVFR